MTLMEIILILILVESGGDDKAIGDGGDAVGCLQIHKIMVDEVNRIKGQKIYKYEDRLNRKKSIEMAKVYLTHQYKRYEKKCGCRPTSSVLAASWNTGSIMKPAPVSYIKKFRRIRENTVLH